uniref:3-deoxy-D-manno-octulosonic acid transferase n=1 Tax=Candidatus Kentrum sp. TUN TaxID=2126343 RepID=A0A450ZM31_9GAMM|nr:MAG: 3-deoxy-D-manno-octulosonic-acid transferase [Candidatus Kentron sp. TUN]VFK54810.1 MAG: 3-deoxy-D-manno-octulosonic-acid transferase [Candidatus Kentron sp. TUN]
MFRFHTGDRDRENGSNAIMSVYSIIHYLIMPFVLLRLFWRGLKAPAYRERWRERFGFGKSLTSGNPRIWIHAVSVGEVQAAVPIVHALRVRYPKTHILVTTTTPTGAAHVAGAFGEAVTHRYVPYDLPDCVQRFLDRVTPSLVLILETELWPNILQACRERAIPVLLVNARLSTKSAGAYRRVSGTTREMLANISAIAAQGSNDADRLITLGANPRHVQVTGSVKFDAGLPSGAREAGNTMRECWGADRPVWIAASTHEGEEERILDVFRKVRKSVPGSLLVLVPRHPERFPKIEALARRHGYDTLLRSNLPKTTTPGSCMEVEVFIGNTMGELPMLYAASDVAFVGGSLVPIGGHNMLEPAVMGIPILFGPHVFNFMEIARNLCACGGARQVQDKMELTSMLIALLQDANARRDMGRKAEAFVQDNGGALDKIMTLVGNFYGSGDSGDLHGKE